MVPTFLRAPLPVFLWENTGWEPRVRTRKSEGKGELFSGPGTPGDRASGDRLSLCKGPVRLQEETSGRQHNRDPGPCPVSRPRLPTAWTPNSATSLGSSGGPRPFWVLCLPPWSPTKTGSLTPRPGFPSSRTPGGSGQRAKAPPPIRAPGPVAAATPGPQSWPPSPPSSSRLRGNKERRRRNRSSGVIGPQRPHHGCRLAITPASQQGLRRLPPGSRPWARLTALAPTRAPAAALVSRLSACRSAPPPPSGHHLLRGQSLFGLRRRLLPPPPQHPRRCCRLPPLQHGSRPLRWFVPPPPRSPKSGGTGRRAWQLWITKLLPPSLLRAESECCPRC